MAEWSRVIRLFPRSSGFRCPRCSTEDTYKTRGYCGGNSQDDAEGMDVTPPAVSHAMYHGDSTDNGAKRTDYFPVDFVGVLGS
jgi:hypothetical protein